MRAVSRLLATVGVVLLATRPAFAHHSFAAEFDGTKPVTLKGTVTKVEWISPHGWVYIDVKGPDGKVVGWAIETAGPNAALMVRCRKPWAARRTRRYPLGCARLRSIECGRARI